MSVVNFRLSPDQGEPSRYVEVIADDGNVGVTAQDAREAGMDRVSTMLQWLSVSRS